jgi:hypothetical protein
MRRPLVACCIAALGVLGAVAAPAAVHETRATGAMVFSETTAVARVAVAAVPSPQSSVPPLAGLALFVAAAAVGAALLGYVTRQRRRAVLVPVLSSAVRLRGPPAVGSSLSD